MKYLLIPYLLWVSCFSLVQAQVTNEIHCIHHKGAYQARTTEDNSGFDVKWYFLDLEADNLSTALAGSVTILVKTTSDIDHLSFELWDDYQVDSITVDGREAAFTHSNHTVEVLLAPVVSEGTLIEATIYYQGQANLPDGFFRGITNATSQDWNTRVTYTLSEPLNALHWFPVKQVLEDKADSVRVHVTTSKFFKVGSNGRLERVVELPGDKHRYEWSSHFPTAYYLIAMTVGPYLEYSFYLHPPGEDSLLVQNYLFQHPDILKAFKSELDAMGPMMNYFYDKFGPYPFADEKYGHVMAPFGGGMEHQTMSSMGTFNFTLIAHELGHQWFGNWVTCDTWQDIWINEGFARYCEYLAIEHVYGKEAAENWRADDTEAILEEPGGSVYIPQASATNDRRIFDFRLTYRKGGQLLHMLRHELNDDDMFFNVIKAHGQAHAHSTAKASDFRSVLETETGKDYGWFFDQWFYGEGYPTYSAVWEDATDTTWVRIKQSPSSNMTPLFKATLPLEFTMQDGTKHMVRVFHEEENQLFGLVLPGKPQKLTLDPESVILRRIDNVRKGGVVGFMVQQRPEVRAYPQPAREYTYLEGVVQLEEITVFDLQGKEHPVSLVQEGARYRMVVTSLPPGMYHAVIKDSKGVFSLPLVVKP